MVKYSSSRQQQLNAHRRHYGSKGGPRSRSGWLVAQPYQGGGFATMPGGGSSLSWDDVSSAYKTLFNMLGHFREGDIEGIIDDVRQIRPPKGTGGGTTGGGTTGGADSGMVVESVKPGGYHSSKRWFEPILVYEGIRTPRRRR